MAVTPVTMYQSNDGQVHPSLVDAEAHELTVQIFKDLGDANLSSNDRIEAKAFMDVRKACKWIITKTNLMTEGGSV